jgi:hypothetical protein
MAGFSFAHGDQSCVVAERGTAGPSSNATAQMSHLIHEGHNAPLNKITSKHMTNEQKQSGKKTDGSKKPTKSQQQRLAARLNKSFDLGFAIDRQLLENMGYDTDELSDSMMQETADQVAEYMDNEYGSSVIAACESFDIPKRTDKPAA